MCPVRSSSQKGSVGIERCKCIAGYYLSGRECLECGLGSYCPGGNARHTCSDNVTAQSACDSLLLTETPVSTREGQCTCPPQTGPPRCPVNRDLFIDGSVENAAHVQTSMQLHPSAIYASGMADINNDGADDIVLHHRESYQVR